MLASDQVDIGAPRGEVDSLFQRDAGHGAERKPLAVFFDLRDRPWSVAR